MLLREILADMKEEEEARGQMNALLDIPKSRREELEAFKAKITRNGLDRADATWLVNCYGAHIKTPLTLDAYSDTPTQIGVSDALQAIAEIESCLTK